MKNIFTIFVGIIVMVMLVFPNEVLAHAFLDHADPKVGSTVDTAPSEIKIWFTEEVEPAFSKIEVRDSKGNEIDKKDSHQDSKDKTLLIVSVPKLPDGEYKGTWSVVAKDTHHTNGDFKFTIKTKS